MEELDDIMGFIREYWNKDHILANDKDFFLYEFQNGNKLNYFLARSKETNAIEAIMGFYPYQKEMKPNESCFSGGILKVYPKVQFQCLVWKCLEEYMSSCSREHILEMVQIPSLHFH